MSLATELIEYKAAALYENGVTCLTSMPPDPSGALSSFRRALFLLPSSPLLLLHAAEAAMMLCDFSAALRFLNRAHQLAKDDEQIKERLAMVHYAMGCIHIQEAEREAAESAKNSNNATTSMTDVSMSAELSNMELSSSSVTPPSSLSSLPLCRGLTHLSHALSLHPSNASSIWLLRVRSFIHAREMTKAMTELNTFIRDPMTLFKQRRGTIETTLKDQGGSEESKEGHELTHMTSESTGVMHGDDSMHLDPSHDFNLELPSSDTTIPRPASSPSVPPSSTATLPSSIQRSLLHALLLRARLQLLLDRSILAARDIEAAACIDASHEDVRALSASVQQKAEEEYGKAMAHILSHNPTAALRCLNEALELRPGDTRFLTLRSKLLREAGSFDEALADIKRGLEGCAQRRMARKEQRRLLQAEQERMMLMQGDARASTSTDAASSSDATAVPAANTNAEDDATVTPDSILAGGQTFISELDVDAATTATNRQTLPQQHSSSPRALVTTDTKLNTSSTGGSTNQQDDGYEDGAPDPEQITLERSLADTFHALGLSYLHTHRDAFSAMGCFDKCIELAPVCVWSKVVTFYVHRADAFLMLPGPLPKEEEAMTDLMRARTILKNKSNAPTDFESGQYYPFSSISTIRPPTPLPTSVANTSQSQALTTIEGKIAAIYARRGVRLFNQQSYAAAEVELSRALSFAPRCSRFSLLRSRVRLLQTKLEPGYADAWHALQCDPGNDEARQLVQQLRVQMARATDLMEGRLPPLPPIPDHHHSRARAFPPSPSSSSSSNLVARTHRTHAGTNKRARVPIIGRTHASTTSSLPRSFLGIMLLITLLASCLQLLPPAPGS